MRSARNSVRSCIGFASLPSEHASQFASGIPSKVTLLVKWFSRVAHICLMSANVGVGRVSTLATDYRVPLVLGNHFKSTAVYPSPTAKHYENGDRPGRSAGTENGFPLLFSTLAGTPITQPQARAKPLCGSANRGNVRPVSRNYRPLKKEKLK